MIEKEKLRRLYWEEKLSIREIAKKLETSSSRIFYIMQKMKIPLRPHSQASKIACEKAKKKGFYNTWRKAMGEAHTKEIDLKPTWNLGYFCGMVMGDGYVYGNKYWRVSLASTKKDWVDLFCKMAKKVFPMFNPFMHSFYKTRSFPNGTKRTDLTWEGVITSKKVYEALAPFKLPDYRWKIPDFLTTEESLAGFIAGLFDAEGSVNKRNIRISSKHIENLVPIKKILKDKFGIKSCLKKEDRVSSLYIYGRDNLSKFLELIRPQLPCKREKIKNYIESQRRTFRHWGSAEDAFLVANYKKFRKVELAKIMNRTKWSLINRARKLRRVKNG